MDRNVLENFIEWANKEYLPNDGKPVCWDKLKEFYESVQTNPDEKPVIVVMAGDGRVNSSKFKALFHTKPSMIQRDQVEAITGFAPGGVCPFNVPNEIPVWLDVSMKRFEYVHPAGGNSFTSVKLTPSELEEVSGATGWCDVCKGWEE